MPAVSPDLEALLRGQESDPFRWLGAHLDRASGRVVVRLFRPGVVSADLLLRHPAETTLPMARRHDAGLFEADVPALESLEGGIDYRFRLRFDSGAEAILDDPYRFGRVISPASLQAVR